MIVGGTNTSTFAVPVTSPALAEISTGPGDTPVTTPASLTVATDGSELEPVPTAYRR